MKTILGYHDKKKERYGIIEGNLPLLVDERFEPFLITHSELFTTKTVKIIEEARAYPVRRAIRSAKMTTATILLVPGILTAIVYIIDFITALAKTSSLPPLLPTWLTNITFWLAVWGMMLLWHETYKKIRIRGRISDADTFSEYDMEAIKKGDLGISKRVMKEILDVLDHESAGLLFGTIRKNQLHTSQLLKKLAEHPNCQTIIDRLHFEDPWTKLTGKITDKSMPSYPVSAVRSILVYAAEEAVLSESTSINPDHLFIALFKIFPFLSQYLMQNELNIDLMRFVSKWLALRRRSQSATQFLNPDVPYFRTGGVASSWIYGYTFVLSHYSKDLTLDMAKKGGHYGIGHDSEMREVLSILSKVTKKHVLLVGESGTGKTSIAKGIAERINRGTIPDSLKGMRIIQLDVNGLVAAGPQFGNLETLVQKTMEELEKAGNTILFIDEIQEIVGVKGEESEHSLAGILLPYVLESSFPIIGTITFADYKKYFYSRESLRQSFESVEIKEVSPDAAFEIILTRLEELELTYNLTISFPAILSAVELAQRYIYDRKLPDSAVSTIETTCARLQAKGEKSVLSKDIAETVSIQTEIPVEDVSAEEATKLLDLENKINAKVIGQETAVHQIVEALKRARTGIRDPKKPIGTYLFLGPTGVGKTYLSKTVGEEYFGSAFKLIRLDMSEFKEMSSVSRLLGVSQTSELSNQSITFLDSVKMHPHSVILLDELEKAHPQILDLFLQVLDEGRMTNANGETINFSNTIIIATSNIGSKILLDTLEKDASLFNDAKEKVLDELRDSIRVEFLNRFDQIIVFSPHSMDNLAKIADLLLNELKGRLLEKEITLRWDDGLPRLIAARSYQPGLGARPMRRYIQDHLETTIAEELLKGTVKPGDTYTATPESLK